MWVFTKYGFFSAVCARVGHGEYGDPTDVERIMIRARLRSHLEALKKRFPELLGRCDIHKSENADYAFRVFVDKRVWSQVLAKMAEETEYDNFKNEVIRHEGRSGSPYQHSLHKVWSVMFRLQR